MRRASLACVVAAAVLALGAARDTAKWRIDPGEGVGPIRIGMTADEVIEKLGEPAKQPDGTRHPSLWSYQGLGLTVGLKAGDPQLVSTVIGGGDPDHPAGQRRIRAFKAKTKQRIGMGSSLKDVERAFGEGEIIEPKEEGKPTTIRYASEGIEFNIADGRVVRLTVYAPR